MGKNGREFYPPFLIAVLMAHGKSHQCNGFGIQPYFRENDGIILVT